ncbi:MAG: BLUF domain-containing protein [Ramlibacter sp.]
MVHPPTPYGAHADDEEVERVICASMASSANGLFAQMEAIRQSSLRHNAALGVHAVLISQSGWFIHWVEGPGDAVGKLLARVRKDSRHHSQRVLHHSRGMRFVPTAWSMVLSPSTEPAADFGARVLDLRYMMEQGRQFAPTSVIRRLTAPMQLAMAQDRDDPEAYHRVGVCSAGANEAFDLVRWLAQRHDTVVHARRYAGETDMDSATDYVDFMEAGEPCRMIAISRPSLQHGMRRAFLPDWPWMLLLFVGDSRRDGALMDRIRDAFATLPFTPTLLGVAPDEATHDRMAAMAQAADLRYESLGVMSPAESPAVWQVLRLHLARAGAPPSSVWAVPEPFLSD